MSTSINCTRNTVCNVPSVNTLFNASTAEPVATAGDAGVLDAGHANGALEVLIEYGNLRYMIFLCFIALKRSYKYTAGAL